MASLKRAGKSDTRVLIFSSFAFTLWHVSAVTLDTGFDLPASETPIYMINIIFLGILWAVLRRVCGSNQGPPKSHAVWNGIDYRLSGFGEKVDALGNNETHICGQELGILGIVLGLAFLALIWRRYAT